MEKPQLINFIAKIMEDSGFKVYKNFKTSQYVIDIYAVLPTNFGDFGVVVECNNYDKDFPVSVEPLKHMEKVGNSIKASKVVVVSSSYFTDNATNYALRMNIKLVDRTDLLNLAKKYQNEMNMDTISDDDTIVEEDYDYDDYDDFGYDYDYNYDYEGSYEYDYDTYMVTQRHSNPAIYQNSLYKQTYNERTPGIFDNISDLLFPRNKGSTSLRNNYSYSSQESIFDLIRPHLGNPVVLILLVVFTTYILSYIGGAILGLDHVIISVLQIFFSLIFAYGFTLLFADRSKNFVVRGTFVFFISLIILIILILL